jgi:hypothetical protein
MKISQLKLYLKRIYRLSLSIQKQEDLVWRDLKKLHVKDEWKFVIDDNEKSISTFFLLSENKEGIFYHKIIHGRLYSTVRILDSVPPQELIKDLFILAGYLNSLIDNGIVVVNENKNIIYIQNTRLIISLLNSDEIYNQIWDHYLNSLNIYGAFQRLITGDESPAIIIDDMRKKHYKGN